MKVERIARNYQTWYVCTFKNGMSVTLRPEHLFEIVDYAEKKEDSIVEDINSDEQMDKRMRRVMEKAE